MPYRYIVITGPKHSGKSLASHALEKILGLETVDLDELVEKQTGKSPRTLYKEGPGVFRKAEEQALASLAGQTEQGTAGLIIAAGGGIADNADAMAWLSRRKEIISVYLDVSAETAWQRILKTSAGGELPPFLKTENPRETHRVLHERRAGVYRTFARIIISAENKNPEEIAKEIAGHPELRNFGTSWGQHAEN